MFFSFAETIDPNYVSNFIIGNNVDLPSKSYLIT